MLVHRFANLLLGDFARRPKVGKRLRYYGRLHAISKIDSPVTAGMKNLLDGDSTTIMDVPGDLFELRKKLVVEQRDLAEVGLPFAERVGIGALVGDDTTARSGNHLGASKLAFGNEAITRVIV